MNYLISCDIYYQIS